MQSHREPGSKQQHPRFSQELRQLGEQFGDRRVQLGEILDATAGRGFNLLLVVISLPFLTPIPLPGFSIPFGLVVAIIGARMAVGKRPWLPQRLLRLELPPRFLSAFLRAASSVLRGLEFFLRPRLALMNKNFVLRRVAGVMIMLSGTFMLVPLPLPFSNSLPAWTVLLLAAGALERDGLFFIAGCVAFAFTSAYFALLVFGGTHAVEHIQRIMTVG